MMTPELTRICEQTVAYALKQGANEVAASISRARFIDLKRREGKIETLQSSTTQGLNVSLYLDGRYSSNSTSFFDDAALKQFIDETLAMTKMLSPDPCRALPDPALYGGYPDAARLDLYDEHVDAFTMEERMARVTEVEAAAQGMGAAILSVTTEISSQASELLVIHSNGFRGERRGTGFVLGAGVTVKDKDDRRPEDYWFTVSRHLEDLPDATEVGRHAGRRAIARLGANKIPSQKMTLLVENRAASRLVGSLFEPLSGASLQQKRSCLESYEGKSIGSPLLTISDDPAIVRGLGSRTFDGDGLAAKPLSFFSEGKLQSYLIDVYYGRKLNRTPTTGGTSNLIFQPGKHNLEALISSVNEGILVSGFLGGNSNPATGDFSFGITGFHIKDGHIHQPISEMNITDNHLKLWQRLVAVGNDPYEYSSWRIPTLMFENVQFSGL